MAASMAATALSQSAAAMARNALSNSAHVQQEQVTQAAQQRVQLGEHAGQRHECRRG